MINSIELSTALVDPSEPVKNRELIRDINKFPYPIGIHIPNGNIKLADWLDLLGSFYAAVEDLLSDLDEIELATERASALVVKEDYVAAKLEVTSEHEIWHLLEQSYYRTQEEIFSPDSQERLDKVESTVKSVESNGCCGLTVDAGNGAVAYFHWDQFQPKARKSGVQALAQRCAVALATNDKAALLEMLNFVQHQALFLREVAEKTCVSIKAVLSEYQHIVITCLLTNSGQLDYLVDNRARLVIDAKGYPRQQPSRDGMKETPIPENITADMIAVSWSEEKEVLDEIIHTLKDVSRTHKRGPRPRRPRNVIAVSPASPVIVRLISEDRVNEIPFSEELVRMYVGGERLAHILLSMIKPRQSAPRPWRSTNVPFRDVTRETSFFGE